MQSSNCLCFHLGFRFKIPSRDQKKNDNELLAQPLYSRCSQIILCSFTKDLLCAFCRGVRARLTWAGEQEDSTTPCGVKGAVGLSSGAQSRLAEEIAEFPLQRTTALVVWWISKKLQGVQTPRQSPGIKIGHQRLYATQARLIPNPISRSVTKNRSWTQSR